MKDRIYLYRTVLKIFFIGGLILLNSTTIYSQEAMEDAIVKLSFSEENDIKTIKATVLDQSGLPIEELDLYFYVKRTFGLLPIGDFFNTTDETGVVTIEFPTDLPGDAEGNVLIIVKIIESDLYHDLTLEETKKWGVPTQIDQSQEKRSLWAAAANAPITLIVSVSSMILVIWFIILYIIFDFYKISKIKPLEF